MMRKYFIFSRNSS